MGTPRTRPGWWTRLIDRLRNRLRRLLARPRRSRDRALGDRGEHAAADFLRAKGYRIIARNAMTPRGEADIVAWDPDERTLVVVEVKARLRTGDARADAIAPEVNITRAKRRRLHAILAHLARANRWTDRPRRVDVVGVELTPDGGAHARLTRGV